jgi:hypothetical protein
MAEIESVSQPGNLVALKKLVDDGLGPAFSFGRAGI